MVSWEHLLTEDDCENSGRIPAVSHFPREPPLHDDAEMGRLVEAPQDVWGRLHSTRAAVSRAG